MNTAKTIESKNPNAELHNVLWSLGLFSIYLFVAYCAAYITDNWREKELSSFEISKLHLSFCAKDQLKQMNENTNYEIGLNVRSINIANEYCDAKTSKSKTFSDKDIRKQEIIELLK
jgi:hypothetical protein